jgi:lysozyme
VKLSDKGKRVLAQVEACVLVPYKDGAHNSIFFGHNGPDADTLRPRTVKKAFEVLEQDLKSREQRVDNLVKVPLTQEQFDALVLLHYQSGNRYLPKAAAMINSGDTAGLKKAWTTWAHSAGGTWMKGLETRRKREKEIFFNSDYGPVEAPIKLWRGNPRQTPFEPYEIKDADLGSS